MANGIQFSLRPDRGATTVMAVVGAGGISALTVILLGSWKEYLNILGKIFIFL